MKRDDSLWKAILEDVFDDFLRFFFPNADELFYLDKGFEYLDKELEQLFPPDQDTYKPRYVDKLVKVFTRQAGKPVEQWVLIHIEVQGYKDPHFAERMFQYYYRIFDKYRKPITAFAIFTDDHKSYHPGNYEQSYLGTHVSYQYNTYKIGEQSEVELLGSTNPFGLVILTAKAALKAKKLTDEELLGLKLTIAKALLSSQIAKGKVRSLLNFLRYYVRLENPAINSKFEKEIEVITQTNKTMGIEEFLLDRAKKEGVEQGLKEKNRAFTKTLLQETSFTMEEIARLVGVPVSFVKKVKKEKL